MTKPFLSGLPGTKAQGYILKTFIRTSVFFAGQSIYIEPVINVFEDLFFRIYLYLSRDFVDEHVFFAA